jgi:hypothetical protein
LAWSAENALQAREIHASGVKFAHKEIVARQKPLKISVASLMLIKKHETALFQSAKPRADVGGRFGCHLRVRRANGNPVVSTSAKA